MPLGSGTMLRICSPPTLVAYIPEISVVRAGAQTGAFDQACT
jgi:hypothetical protein